MGDIHGARLTSHFFVCRNSHIILSINMVRSKSVFLKRRVTLVNEELSVGLKPAAAHNVDMNANIIAVKENPGLQSWLISEVERTIGPSCQLAYCGSPAIDQLDTAYMDAAGRSVEDFFDKTDADLEVRINSLLAQVKDLQGQVVSAMTLRASYQAVDWRRSLSGGGLPLAPSGSYISSTNLGASSSSSQALITDTSEIPLPTTTNVTGADTGDTSG